MCSVKPAIMILLKMVYKKREGLLKKNALHDASVNMYLFILYINSAIKRLFIIRTQLLFILYPLGNSIFVKLRP